MPSRAEMHNEKICMEFQHPDQQSSIITDIMKDCMTVGHIRCHSERTIIFQNYSATYIMTFLINVDKKCGVIACLHGLVSFVKSAQMYMLTILGVTLWWKIPYNPMNEHIFPSLAHQTICMYTAQLSCPQSVTTTGWDVFPLVEPTDSTVFTTSMPLVTLPKTTCLPSSHGVFSVQRKNWLPLVPGPALAIERMPGPVCLS